MQQFRKMIPEIFPLVGGVDMITTPIMIKPGAAIFSQNFEPDINGGYRRMKGIERHDGRPRPSDGLYYIVVCSVTGTVAVGNTITGVTSGATAKVISVTSTTEIVVTKVVGTFVAETFNVGGSPQGTITSVTKEDAATNQLHSTYKNLAADDYRADIAAVPGSGYVRGVNYYKGILYALRDNAGATACVLHKSTSSGWTAITFGREIQFNSAVGQINEANTVTGLTSGASAVVKRALLRTGTWTASGVGTLVFDTVTGAFQSGEALQVGGVTKATSTSADTAITLLPGGKFEIENNNFSGNADNERMYCSDGVNLLGEFDGTRWVPIRTGMTVDKPKFIAIHKKHAFAAIESEVHLSGVGDPYSWTALTGAAQIATGQTITGMKPQVGDASNGVLVILTNKKVLILYGNDTTDFNLVTHSPESGGRPYTIQNIGFAHYWDVRGATQLVASQVFGSFQSHILTNAIQPYVDQKAGLEIASCIVRNSNLYRIFFSDGTGVHVQIKPNETGSPVIGDAMPFDYGSRVMNAICSTIDTSGIERKFGACTDGYVYELDVGTSFDGDVIPAFVVLAFNHSKSSYMRKTYKRCKLRFDAGTTAHLSISYDLSFGNFDSADGDLSTMTVTGAGGYWDTSNWDSIFWDAAYSQEATIDTPGNGTSISLTISNESDLDESFVINTCEVQYLMGRLVR